MAGSTELVAALRAELRAAGLTYAHLAAHLGASESTVKRMFSRADMTLSRLDEIMTVLGIDLGDLQRRIAGMPRRDAELSQAQERALVADRKLMLVAICCQSEWSFEQMLRDYLLSEAELVRYLVRLDRIGLIELRQQNRYTLKLAKGFRWRPHGPVMAFFRERAMNDYFAGGFDGEAESLLLVHGTIARSAAPAFAERLRRLAHDFSLQHLADQGVGDPHRGSFTLVLAMREWIFAEFADLIRPPPG